MNWWLSKQVQSYLDNLDFGLISCRELVPDLWDLCDLLPAALDELLAAAALENPASAPSVGPKKRGSGPKRGSKSAKRGSVPAGTAKRRGLG